MANEEHKILHITSR